MSEDMDFTQVFTEAQVRRQAATEAEVKASKSQRSELVGDLLLDLQSMLADTALDHDAKMARLQGALGAIHGGASGTVVASAAPALSADQQELLELQAEGTLRKTEFGAWQDRRFNRLRKEHERSQTASAVSDDVGASTETPEKASAPAPAKKGATKVPEPAKEPEGFLDRIRERARQIAENAKQ